MNPTGGVRYTVPSTIDPERMENELTVRFRAGAVFKNCYVSVYFDQERVIRRRRQIVAPGAMEETRLTKEQLSQHADLKIITVTIEEA